MWEKVARQGRMRGVGATAFMLRIGRLLDRMGGVHTPQPSGSACHLLPQGEKGA
ncbi:hypothetical protein HMPREF0185_01127 [Brevundimonas diminuta 470-4]|nr:hypothetical protein HMPREF0185_01127 [Brevundimonas diminuta 470-4]